MGWKPTPNFASSLLLCSIDIFFFEEENVLLTFETSNTNKLTNLMNENDNTIKKIRNLTNNDRI